MATTALSSLKVLFVGGTGTISASSARLAAERGMDVFVLNRSRNVLQRSLPDSVTSLAADMTDSSSVERSLDGLQFDAVVNFLSFNHDDTVRAMDLFRGRTRHYIHISTAALYCKPIQQVPISESTIRRNGCLQYARDKIDAEDAVMRAHLEEGFPATIVRPSHTYDEASPPLAGGWTVFDRIESGKEVVVHGDGTSLWTLTHAADFALGLVGLIGNQRAIGEAFHITSSDVYTWDQIHELVGDALGIRPRIVHVPSAFYPLAAPDWFWSELVVGDLSHSALFDNSKIRLYVPDFVPSRTFVRAVVEMAAWRRDHRTEAVSDGVADAAMDRLVSGYHASREIFAGLGPRPS